jgi:hypothetical protein
MLYKTSDAVRSPRAAQSISLQHICAAFLLSAHLAERRRWSLYQTHKCSENCFIRGNSFELHDIKGGKIGTTGESIAFYLDICRNLEKWYTVSKVYWTGVDELDFDTKIFN